MSRSYRAPYATQGYGGCWRKLAKKLSNRKVRKIEGYIPDGKAYIKLGLNPWLICDWRFPIGGPERSICDAFKYFDDESAITSLRCYLDRDDIKS